MTMRTRSCIYRPTKRDRRGTGLGSGEGDSVLCWRNFSLIVSYLLALYAQVRAFQVV